jgi:hypothetical protein
MPQTGRHPLYQAALDADAVFQTELIRVYGASKAPDARYKQRHEDQALTRAGWAKQSADAAWHLACYNHREHF